jgi:uncharacterized protein (TIGR02145 family)
MNSISKASIAKVLVLLIFIVYSCKMDKLMLPTITNTFVINVSSTTAASGATVTNDGGAPVLSKGVCWNTSVDPTVENSKTIESEGTGSFTSNITKLIPNTLYYLRAYATNSVGTAYADQESFTTSSGALSETVTDVEGNIYNAITIGNQTWMKENLKTTKYRNYTDIPLVTEVEDWFLLTTPGYCWYNNNSDNKDTDGALYNWYAVDVGRNGDKNICPIGWHVPSDTEWSILMAYLGGDSVAVGKLKEIGNVHWDNPNTDATNESGFTALPGGARDYGAAFFGSGRYGYWWSSTAIAVGGAWSRYVGFDGSGGSRSASLNQCGFSVRCLKDN